MANWTKKFESNGTTISISDKAAVMVQQDGKFLGCLTSRAFMALVGAEKEVLGQAFECLVEMGEEYGKNKETRKIEAQIAKLTKQNEELKAKLASSKPIIKILA